MVAATAAAAAASAATPSFIASCSCSSFHLIQRQRQRPRSPSLSLSLPFTLLEASRSSTASQTLVDSDLGFRGARPLLSCWSGLKQLTISFPSFPPNSGVVWIPVFLKATSLLHRLPLAGRLCNWVVYEIFDAFQEPPRQLIRLVFLGKRRKLRGKVVYASLFGVGAPEALVIGVVALLVFGPKGLAEVARNLGKTLRAFQPTIRELQDVSREFKSTLEREIGLDEVSSSTNNTFNSFSNENQQARIDPNGAPKSAAYTSEDLLKITQEQLATSATAPQSPVSSPPQDQQQVSTSNVVPDASSKVTASSTPEAASQIQPSEKPKKES